MVEQVKILIIIMVFGSLGFLLARKVYIGLIERSLFNYWQSSWVLIVSAACLASNYWLFAIIIIMYGWFSVSKLKGKAIFLYIFLLPALPMLSNELPGFAGIRLIFEFSYPRMLSLAILLPLFFHYKSRMFPFGKTVTDKWFLALVLYLMLLSWTRSESVTDSMRSMLYIVTDYLLPYFVVSRLIDNAEKLRFAFIAVVSSFAILAAVNIVEYFKHWFVYQELYRALNISYGGFSAYSMVRDGMLRTSSVFASPIVLGYIATIALGAFLGIRAKKTYYYRMLFLLLLSALLTPLSRGPWVGFLVFIIVFIWYAPRRNKSLAKFIIYGTLSFIVLLMTPYGTKIINLLPFVGDTDSGNISYRQDLFFSGLSAIKNNIFFGDKDFRLAPELQHLIQGQGIIDIVNTYLQMALQYGIVGLGLFMLFFIQPMRRIIILLRNRNLGGMERYLAASLLAVLAAIMVIIATVSQIDYIPIYYILIVSILSALIRVLINLKSETPKNNY